MSQIGLIFIITVGFIQVSCVHKQSLPERQTFRKFEFPYRFAYPGRPDRPYEILKEIRSRVNFNTLDLIRPMASLCQNYYNQAVKKMVRRTKKAGGDAVIQIKSVVYLMNGRQEEYRTPECVDLGAEGQILVKAYAIRWKSHGKSTKKTTRKSSRKLRNR